MRPSTGIRRRASLARPGRIVSTGLKDTVLLYPNESVEVVVRFDAHPGLFLLHCHNLEHEDMGMMANILVE